MGMDEKPMTERERAEEKVGDIVKELDRPTLALLYKTLHDARKALRSHLVTQGFLSPEPTKEVIR